MGNLSKKVIELESADGSLLKMRLKTAKRCYIKVNSLLHFICYIKKAELRMNRPSNKKDISRMTREGKKYGYPKCCIDSFLRLPIENRTENQNKSTREGFIPCPYHADLIVNGKTTIEELVAPKRLHKLPFPDGY